MSKQNPLALPWQLDEEARNGVTGCRTIEDCNGVGIASTHGLANDAEDKAIAEHIINSANCYDKYRATILADKANAMEMLSAEIKRTNELLDLREKLQISQLSLRALIAAYVATLDDIRQGQYDANTQRGISSAELGHFATWVEARIGAPQQPATASGFCPHCKAVAGQPHAVGCLLRGAV